MKASIGIIGGSGLYDLPGARHVDQVKIETPFGDTSDEISLLEIGGVSVAFIPRHGKNHSINPSFVNSRANVFALKTMGIKQLISVSAVGSLQEAIHPREFLIPDQIIDRTKSRVNSFFEPYAVHVGFAEPFCKRLSSLVYNAACKLNIKTKLGGTYVCMEGPLFSTKAESALYRSWGASIIGMTSLPEAKLAREAEICYSTIALVTDYDVWKENEEVDVSSVLENIKANSENVKQLIIRCIPEIAQLNEDCSCQSALANAFLTNLRDIPRDTQKSWGPLIGKYSSIEQD